MIEQPRHPGADAGWRPDAEHWRSPTQSPSAVKPLVTFTRQYASGGSAIAHMVVERLGEGWTLIDNEFIDEVARRAGLPRDEVARLEERAPGLLERLARTLAVGSPEMLITGEHQITVDTDEETIVKMTERVIAEAASEGRVVLVGRGAQAVLASRPNALHVYVVGSLPFRRKIAVERLGVDPASADKVIAETDLHRDHYVKSHYGRDRQDLTQYDVVLNAERLGFEGAADVVVGEVKRRGWR
ncbi:MAG TPA: cytidylate kinase-like family protein [Gemmatimonadales bacterium]|nr:cytidylate kinase-like family protein [Gemmatimonadales bacterium]